MTRSRNVEPAGSIPDRGAQESAGPRAFTGQARHRFPKSELMAAATLALAVAAGGYLRFAHLGARELSADEGASWAAASLSSVAQIVRQQPLLNPGKLALHDLALHVWMRLLGDSLYAMRSLSALAGTVAIIAVFLVTRELFSAADSPVLATHESRNDPHDLLSAFAALLFAVNLVTIKYSQEARMYALALLLGLLQAWFFLRLVRRPTAFEFALVAFFTALSIASTFTLTLILVPETLWLAYLLARKRERVLSHASICAGALAAGLVLLAIPFIVYLRARASAPPLTAYSWSPLPPLWAPIALFNKATGSFAFPALFALAAWGVVCEWGRDRDAIVFILLWMLAPPIVVLAASYLLRPAFVERYMLTSFVPFFILAAVGIRHLRGAAASYAVLALVAALAIAHLESYDRKPHGAQWREAATAAHSMAGTAGTIAVAPPYAVNVVRYYLRNSPDVEAVRLAREQPPAHVVIIADTGVSARDSSYLDADYPHLMTRLRGVIVRAR